MRLRDILDDFAIDLGLVEDRAGRYPRQLARERLKAVISGSWRRFVPVLVVALAATGLTVFLPSWCRGFVAGAWVATVVWVLVLLVVQVSGVGPTQMGATAEQWTAQELRRLRSRGWKVTSHVAPTYGDIDHVAVGPGGLIVIESKWRSEPSEFVEHGLVDSCHRLAENARRLRLMVKARLGEAPTRAVLVLWSPAFPAESGALDMNVEEVAVVEGRHLRRWLDAQTDSRDNQLDVAAIDSAWHTLTGIERTTDRRELGTDGSLRLTPMRQLLDLGIGLSGGLLALLVSGWIFRLLGAVSLVPVAGLAGVGFVGWRSQAPWRTSSFGAGAGAGIFLVTAAAFYAYAAAVHG